MDVYRTDAKVSCREKLTSKKRINFYAETASSVHFIQQFCNLQSNQYYMCKMTVEAVCSRLEKHHATKFNKFDKHNGYRLNSKNFTVN